MSHLMDYGPDWPPPEPTRPSRRPRRLWQVCALWIGVYLVIAVGAVLAVRLFVPPFDPHDPPLAPNPANATSHP